MRTTRAHFHRAASNCCNPKFTAGFAFEDSHLKLLCIGPDDQGK
jgi:hypothetical protein